MSHVPNEPRVRVVMGAKRVFYASLTAAQVLKNEHDRNRGKWPGPDAHRKSPLQMSELAKRVMQNEIERHLSTEGVVLGPGLRVGKLVVLGMVINSGLPVKWNCLCDCGREKQVRGKHLQDGGTKSCGCLKQDSARRRWAKARKAAA